MNEDAIAAYGTGAAGIVKLRRELQLAWDEVRSQEEAVAEIAKILQVNPSQIATLDEPLVKLKVGQSGLGVVETAIIVFVGHVLYDVSKDLTKDAISRCSANLAPFPRPHPNGSPT
jgi:hypothetical protein